MGSLVRHTAKRVSHASSRPLPSSPQQEPQQPPVKQKRKQMLMDDLSQSGQPSQRRIRLNSEGGDAEGHGDDNGDNY